MRTSVLLADILPRWQRGRRWEGQPVLSIDKARYLVYPMSRRCLSYRPLSPVTPMAPPAAALRLSGMPWRRCVPPVEQQMFAKAPL